ncbi:MAG: hypothetical protein QNJ68_09165 [Microcoleaceae cyanobacterium MO_207.B10]|nr:hypothetical protein [Microcoleaceae cyanobacterium MO_207.B10]
MKFNLLITKFFIFATTWFWLLLCSTALARTLITKNFKITISSNCQEGQVSCNNVSYEGVDLNTGKSIKLIGKTVHRTCGDGITPCQFIGYEFRNGNYRYIVTEDGTLLVYEAEKLLLQESGTWER